MKGRTHVNAFNKVNVQAKPGSSPKVTFKPASTSRALQLKKLLDDSVEPSRIRTTALAVRSWPPHAAALLLLLLLLLLAGDEQSRFPRSNKAELELILPLSVQPPLLLLLLVLTIPGQGKRCP